MTWERVVVVVALWMGWTAGAHAQHTPASQVFRQVVEGCTREAGADAAYTCACTAVALVQRCEGMGARAAPALLACVQQNEQAWAPSIVSSCRTYGALRLGPGVRAPAQRPLPPPRGGVPVMGDVQVWNLFYNGCIRDDPNVAYACGCFATATIAACVATGSSPATHVESCVQGVSPELEQLAAACSAPTAMSFQPGAPGVVTGAAPAPAAASGP